jgi:hypothetical protein
MENQVAGIRDFILKQVAKHPHDLVRHTMAQFNVSRTTVSRHMQYLLNQNKITKTGNTKQITYTLTANLNKQLTIKLNNHFDEFDCFNQHFSDLLKQQLNQNAYAISEYVMTELLNNCKDHANGSKVMIQTYLKENIFYCSITDDGEGLFKTIQDSATWDDIRDVLFELSKGKLTRDPMNHSGEGIFFSSRAVDRLSIDANGYQFVRDNLEEDWTFCESSVLKGTCVVFEIYKNTDRNLETIFESYTDKFSFNKTDILVDLSQHFGERLISRSQAKRVCRRLENFTYITLDFKKVEAVGQGFVDQIFRIYQREYPNIVIQYIHANTSVDFMIKRCLAMQS